ncbi:unnamed protein product, partial [Xylocopa violacea]
QPDQSSPKTPQKLPSSNSSNNDYPSEPNESDSSSAQYVCEYPGCGRSFTTKTGRGVHHKRGHPDWNDTRLSRPPKKARWNVEEISLLARCEAQLTIAGEKFINQALVKSFPSRTLESIKGQRKSKAYKKLVADAISDLQSVSSDREAAVATSDVYTLPADGTCAPEERLHLTVDWKQTILDLPLPKSDNFQCNRLAGIRDRIRWDSPESIFEDLSLYLRDVLLVSTPRRVGSQDCINAEGLSRRQRRRAEYARTQDLWRKNRHNCLRSILKDVTCLDTPPKEEMIGFWQNIMTREPISSLQSTPPQAVFDELWSPVTQDEIKKALPMATTAAGPDGLSPRLLKSVPLEVLTVVCNIILWCGKLPSHLLESRTILLPKKHEAKMPGDFRPITISSVLVRVLHKVLATRMGQKIALDQRQRAFRNSDGCAENIFLLDTVLRYHHQAHKPLFIASLDVAKAFDSVSHGAVLTALRSAGVPKDMIQYLQYVYGNCTTRLECKDWRSDRIRPLCGVKQGDPLSPIIFNIIIDGLWKRLPKEVAADIDGVRINAAAFADDILLMASTEAGLQRLIDNAVQYLLQCGLSVNANKSLTVSLRSVPHVKKTIVDNNTLFTCNGLRLPALKRTDTWMYLGVPFSPEGRISSGSLEKLTDALVRLSKAPLKPQQRLFGLRTMVLPGLYHTWSLGKTNISLLNKADKVVRATIRKWTTLPHDTLKAYFYASLSDGGLGVPCLRWKIPLLRLKRLSSLGMSRQASARTPGNFLEKEIQKQRERLNDHGVVRSSNSLLARKWSNLLYNSPDGAGLRESVRTPGQNSWIGDGTMFLSGRDYINFIKLRFNALPTRSRTTRGRRSDRNCRGGCLLVETLNHVLQICHRTHGARIKRHNALVSYTSRALDQQGYNIELEPAIQTIVGTRKPDIIAHRGRTALVIDAQVVGEQADLDMAHNKKTNYYSTNNSLVEAIKRRTSADRVIFSSITLSCRGIWSLASANQLLSLGVIRKKDIKILSTRVLLGGMLCFSIFNRTTGIRRVWARSGIG